MPKHRGYLQAGTPHQPLKQAAGLNCSCEGDGVPVAVSESRIGYAKALPWQLYLGLNRHISVNAPFNAPPLSPPEQAADNACALPAEPLRALIAAHRQICQTHLSDAHPRKITHNFNKFTTKFQNLNKFIIFYDIA
ncbi:hypothetical protein [Andreprevotia lacus]|jgi:hypothetical protein|uniref:hypothetical protein n=1 Tax=Andreprevotia lacus TaxID=1121000 RepID=UPI00111C34CC|nr:hypothetical protein [Andreprevotia lacus]